MKRILNIALAILAISILGGQAANARQAEERPVVIGKPAVSVSPRSDSLRVSIAVGRPSVPIGRNQSFTASFRIVGEGKEYPLPELVYTGSKRFRYTRRSEILSGTWRNAENRHTVIVKRGNVPAEYRYEALIPSAEWLGGARLHAEYIYHNACSDSVIGSDVTDFLWGADSKPAAAEEPVRAVIAETPQAKETPEVVIAYEVPLQAPSVEIPAAEMKIYATYPKAEADGGRQTVTAVLYYLNNETEMIPGMYGNRDSYETLRRALEHAAAEGVHGSAALSVTGYASPEGAYLRNEDLARARVRNCVELLSDDDVLSDISLSAQWVAEDWDGVIEYLERVKPTKWTESLRIINGTGIFDGREKKLMELGAGNPYRHLLKEAFPPLRRVEIRLDYTTGSLAPQEAEAKVLSGNGSPSLGEIFAAASQYGPDDDRFLRIYMRAAELYPDDPAVNNNLAAAYLSRGDAASAAVHLGRTGNLPDAYVNKGVCRYMEGDKISARIYFTLAAKENIEQGAKNLLLIGKEE